MLIVQLRVFRCPILLLLHQIIIQTDAAVGGWIARHVPSEDPVGYVFPIHMESERIPVEIGLMLQMSSGQKELPRRRFIESIP